MEGGGKLLNMLSSHPVIMTYIKTIVMLTIYVQTIQSKEQRLVNVYETRNTRYACKCANVPNISHYIDTSTCRNRSKLGE